MSRKFRVWRPSLSRMDYFTIGQEAAVGDDDIVMLGSGIEDSNGKEIFDLDIVSATAHGTLDQIIFTLGCFCLCRAVVRYEATYWGDEITVFGNAFQSPELVEQLKAQIERHGQ